MGKSKTEIEERLDKILKLLTELKKDQYGYLKNKVLTFDQGCHYLGYAKSYVYKLTSAGIVPSSKPHGKSIFFDREKLEAWMLSNSKTSWQEKRIEAATYVTTHPLRSKKV